MTPAGEILRDEIRRAGPIPFRRFMEVALYHPEHGYYRRERDPFGREGDFYTAEQLQPVFGILMASVVRALLAALPAGHPRVVELGAGRGEMAPAFAAFDYLGIDIDGPPLPRQFAGVVFANEFFDALPVDAVRREDGAWRLLRVAATADGFTWVDGEAAGGEMAEYLDAADARPEEGHHREVCLEAWRWLERLAVHVECGWLVAVDYGYTPREAVRFPAGTLMSYRRHQAREDVLAEPGRRDITAHVAFGALERHAARAGWRLERRERLGLTLLGAGEVDQFAAALAAATDGERRRRALQLQTLLYGMGETFETLLFRRERT